MFKTSHLFYVLCALLLILGIQAGTAFTQDVWISFAGTNSSNVTLPYLMKINASGDILVGPKQILTAAQCAGQGCFPALTDGIGGNIVMIVARVTTQANFARTIVDKSTLHAGNVKNLGVVQAPNTFPGALQVTQFAAPKFMVVKTDTQNSLAFPLTSKGLVAGSSWRVNPRVESGLMFQIGVSPDALMSWGINLNSSNPPFKIYVQPLNSRGRASGDPAVAGSGINLDSVDITNVLPNTRRFLAYTEEGNFTSGKTIKLQVIDGKTGEKVGAPNDIIGGPNTGFIQNIALDPMGRFIVWNEPSSCGGVITRFQALSSNGNTTGGIKTLVGCGDIIISDFLDSMLD